MIMFVIRVTLLMGLLLMLNPLHAFARTPYNTFYNDPNTSDLRIQNLYTAARFVTGQETTGTAFSSPSDLFIDIHDHVFIADTGNNRIVELDDAGKFIRIVGGTEGESQLNAPEGVFVTKDGTIYVADTGNKRVAIYNAQGVFQKAMVQPKSELLPKSYYFVPKKLIVDARGVLYIVVDGSYQGLFRMDNKGEFKGFIGANSAKKGWLIWVKQKMYTQEQLDKDPANRPIQLSNIALDHFGFIVGVSSERDVNHGQIKRLSGGGSDRLRDKPMMYAKQLADAAVDENDFMYVVDKMDGVIAIYDPEGNALFRFGDITVNTWQKGLHRYPTSIAVNSKHELWVSDGDMNIIQVFKRTEFGESLLTGATLYYNGHYKESKPYFEQAGLSNEMINLTYQGMGKIALGENRYKDAMAYYQISYDAKGYSEAFWSIRLQWLRQYLVIALFVIAAAVFVLRMLLKEAAVYASRRTWSRQMRQYAKDIKDAGYVMIHPYDGFYRLKDRKISYLIVILILAAAVMAKVATVYLTGFIFNPVNLSEVNIWLSLLTVFVPWVTWVIANYLVSAVKDGEGRFREVVQASAYALVPFILFSIPILILSNVLVLDEKVIFTTLNQIMFGWLIVLFFVMTQVIHNFEFMENGKNIVITIFTILIIWIFMLIMSGLAFNLYDFFYQLYKEVTFRGWI